MAPNAARIGKRASKRQAQCTGIKAPCNKFRLELQTAFACGIGQRLDAAVVAVARAIECDLLVTRSLGALGDHLANLGSGFGAEVSLADFRKDLLIEVYNEAGQVVITYKVFRCWVSEFQAQADLDANGNAVLIQSIKLENEGWERDIAVQEPAEPALQS